MILRCDAIMPSYRSVLRTYEIALFDARAEHSPDQAKAWIDAGDVPELSQAKKMAFVDIDSGHWPMVSRPAELARILDAANRKY